MDNTTVIGTALRSTLLADPQIAELVGGNRIYFIQAPQQATFPYILYAYAGGGKDNNSAKGGFDVYIGIKAVAQTSTQARFIAGLINEALDEKYLTFTEGFEAFAPVTEQEPILQVTDVQTVQYWSAGHVYRIRAARI